MFIFVTDQELWIRELMDHIMRYDIFMGRKDILNSFSILRSYFLYIFKHFFTIGIMQ
jgi:hypothetical protein